MLIEEKSIDSNTSGVNAPAAKSKIYKIKITDQLGNVKKTYSYPLGVTSAKLDFSSLVNSTYIMQTYDNNSWDNQQFVILK